MITTAKPLTLGSHSTQEKVESQYKSGWEKHDRERLLAVLMAYEKDTLHRIGSTLRRGRATIARWLAVDPPCHGRGIGSALIASSLDWMRERGVKYAELLTDQNNIAAIRAYEKNNFRVIYSSIVLSQYL